MGKPAGLVLLILGLILGPGYFVYTRFYTGREITELPLEFQRQADGLQHAVVRFDVLPVMGAVTVMVNITASHGPTLSPPNTPRNRYQARIILEGTTVLTHSFTLRTPHVEASPAQVFRQALPVLRASIPGKYTLDLVQEEGAEMEVKQASIQVRAGVQHVNRTTLITGAVLMVAGLASILLAP